MSCRIPGPPRGFLLSKYALTESAENPIGTISLGYIETRKGTLVLSVNSREDAKRGRELLVSRLGGHVDPAFVAHQTSEQARERSRPAPDEPEVPPEQALSRTKPPTSPVRPPPKDA